MKKKIIWTIVCILVAFFVFRTFDGRKKLPGINYIILEGDIAAYLCYYEGWRDGFPVTNGGYVHKVLWNDKYIIAYADFPWKPEDIRYYIVEQLDTDTFKVYNGEKIPWTSYHPEPWIAEEFESYDDFNSRLQELKIDTTQMQHYSWKAWVGIY